MPPRINKIRHDENTRAKIKVAAIITRLQKLITGQITGEDMPSHAVSAALGLLRKVLPDTNSVEINAEITTTKVIRAPQVADATITWSKEHGLNGQSQAKH